MGTPASAILVKLQRLIDFEKKISKNQKICKALKNGKTRAQTTRRCRNPPKRSQKPRGAVLRVASCFQHVFTHPWHQKSRPRATCPPKLCEDTYQKTLKAERGANTFSKRLAVLSPRPASRRRTTGAAKDKKGDKGIAKTNYALKTHLQNALMREHRHPFEGSGHRCLESRPEHAPAPKLLETQSRTRMHVSARSVIQLSPTCVCTLGPNGGSEFADAINFVLNFNTNQASRPEMWPVTLTESAWQL